MSDNINVCISCDDNYAKYAGVVMASILLNATKNDNLSFYILDGGISDNTKSKINELKSIKNCSINFVEINQSEFDLYRKIPTHKYISMAAYYRLKLTELLPEVDRVIYLDCDVIVCKSLSDLFNIELKDEYIAGVLDARVKYKPRWKNTIYVNSGVLLMDLKKFRADNIGDIFLSYTQNHFDEIKTGDQDIINFALKDKIRIADDRWNVQVSSFLSRSSFTKDPYIIHYIARQKPWIFGSYNHFKNEYFKVLEYTPWAISHDEKIKWGLRNNVFSFFNFIKDKPLFFVRPKFWEAVFKTIF